MSYKLVSLIVLGAVALAAVAAEQKLTPLKLELPTAKPVGTLEPIRAANLEPVGTQPPPDLMVPAGTTNLAAKKPVTASDPAPTNGELFFVTDGVKDGVDGTYVELGPQLQWVQIDLGKPATLHAVVVWHYVIQRRAYHDVVVQVADDPDFVTGVKTLYNNDHDNSAGLGVGKDKGYVDTNAGKVIDAKGVTARYVRLSSRGNTANDMNHYIEVEVYGKVAP